MADITNIVLGSICWNLVEKAETIRFLAENERNESLGILTRSFLELFVQYKFILKRETDKRTESYFYAYKVSSAEKIKAMLDYDQSHNKLTENDIMVGFEYMGFFLGIGFLAMLISCLMFKILSGLNIDKSRYLILAKIGASEKSIKGVVLRELPGGFPNSSDSRNHSCFVWTSNF